MITTLSLDCEHVLSCRCPQWPTFPACILLSDQRLYSLVLPVRRPQLDSRLQGKTIFYHSVSNFLNTKEVGGLVSLSILYTWWICQKLHLAHTFSSHPFRHSLSPCVYCVCAQISTLFRARSASTRCASCTRTARNSSGDTKVRERALSRFRLPFMATF